MKPTCNQVCPQPVQSTLCRIHSLSVCSLHMGYSMLSAYGILCAFCMWTLSVCSLHVDTVCVLSACGKLCLCALCMWGTVSVCSLHVGHCVCVPSACGTLCLCALCMWDTLSVCSLHVGHSICVLSARGTLCLCAVCTGDTISLGWIICVCKQRSLGKQPTRWEGTPITLTRKHRIRMKEHRLTHHVTS